MRCWHGEPSHYPLTEQTGLLYKQQTILKTGIYICYEKEKVCSSLLILCKVTKLFCFMNGDVNNTMFIILNKNLLMKKSFLFLIAMAFGFLSFANSTDSIPVNTFDVSSPDAIIKAVYDVISGPAGEKRNWGRMRTLFTSDARMMATGKKANGDGARRSMSVEDYISTSGPFLEKNGFFEKEIGRKTERYGSIVHVFSTYESKKTLSDEMPFMRGINSFQLWNDGKRWWVLSILWESETKENPIPEKYINGTN